MSVSLNKNIRVILTVSGLVMSFAVISLLLILEASAKTPNTKPYKATTVDECIQEEECFWHHLLLATQLLPIKQQATKNINIKKWEHAVKYRRIGSSDTLNEKVSLDVINQTLPYFRQEFIPQDEYNFIIYVTDDIAATISGKMKQNFDALFGPSVASKLYEDAEKPKCFYLYVQDKGQNRAFAAYFAFIDRSHPDILACYKEVVYAGLGLADISYSPIVQSSKNTNKYTKLELALLLYLYQDFIKSGMRYEHLEATFDKSYDLFINQLKHEGMIK